MAVVQPPSLIEKLGDVAEKVGIALAVVKGLLPGGDFRLTTEKIRGVDQKVFSGLPPALGDTYNRWFKEYAEREWIIYGNERITFGEGKAIVDALAAELVGSFGVQRGDRVGIAMRNLPEYMLSFLAITAMGGVAVPLNALWKGDEMKYGIKDSNSKLIIGDLQRLKLCLPFADELGLKMLLCRGSTEDANGIKAAEWSKVIEQGKTKPAPGAAGVGAEDDAMIMYTSGSTGFPKGVCHTQRSVGTAIKLGEMMTRILPPSKSQLLAVPLFHITALAPIFLWSIPAGSKLIMMHKWDAGEAIKLIESEKIERFTGVPTMVSDILSHPSYTPEKIASMKNMMAGGAPVPPSHLAKMRSKAKGTQGGQGYGLTETMAFGCVNRGVDYAKHPTSCGKPIPLLVQVKIKDPETGKEVPNGERGEVCLKSAMIMKCYWNRPEDTKKVIDEEGFFHSGDIGKMEGGFVYILDRLKDLIIRGGENIECAEVEAAIYTHPSVRECSVFGLPDERLGEVVGAAVWVDGDLNPSELSETCRKSLANFKVPEAKHIFIVKEQLPKGATGKIDKKGMRDQYAKMIAPQSKL